jgi:hypothetical protein
MVSGLEVVFTALGHHEAISLSGSTSRPGGDTDHYIGQLASKRQLFTSTRIYSNSKQEVTPLKAMISVLGL